MKEQAFRTSLSFDWSFLIFISHKFNTEDQQGKKKR